MAITVLLIGVLTISATYAWLGVSRVPFVSDVSLSVMTSNSLQIAHDESGKPGEWGDNLDASAYLKGMTSLKPVTYTPEGFRRIIYDHSGRTNGTELIKEENINVHYPEGASKSVKEAAEDLGYLVRLDFWMKSEGAYASVYLSDAIKTADGQMGAGTYVVGAPAWNTKTYSHDNGGHGSETTIRLGFEMTPYDLEGKVSGHKRFVMYEPNADIHYDKTTGYKETKSVNGGPLIDKSLMIIQNASKWNEKDPILQDEVIYQPGTFTQNQQLFAIDTGTMMKVSLYIWMEGQDVDCIATAVADTVHLAANIQFNVKAEDRSSGIVRGN